MATQCERLEAELRKGRVLSPMEIINELHICKYTNRISELRKKGLKIKVEDKDGYGLYSLENEAKMSEKQPIGAVQWYQCEHDPAHKFPFYGDGPKTVPCSECNYRYSGVKTNG